MNNNDTTSASKWLDRLKSEVNRDKKKTIVLVILLTIAGILGGKSVIKYQPGHIEAAGVDNHDTPSTDSLVEIDNTSKSTDRECQALATKMKNIDKKITRDLFKPDPRYFPLARKIKHRVILMQKQQKGIFEQIHNWVEDKYNLQRQRILKIETLRNEAESLSLQSTVVGPSPTALINGRIMRIGDTIKGFRIASIAPNTCIISKDGVKLELRMKQ